MFSSPKHNPNTNTVEKKKFGCRMRQTSVCCFAGASDELVVAASFNDDLHVWSVPEGRLVSSAVNQQIMHLTFDDNQYVSGVFYNKHRSTLVSCSLGNHIKAWTAVKLPHLPTETDLG